MTNKEILSKLKSSRQVSAFARFLGMTREGVYYLLSNDKPQYNQEGNYINFMEGLK